MVMIPKYVYETVARHRWWAGQSAARTPANLGMAARVPGKQRMKARFNDDSQGNYGRDTFCLECGGSGLIDVPVSADFYVQLPCPSCPAGDAEQEGVPDSLRSSLLDWVDDIHDYVYEESDNE